MTESWVVKIWPRNLFSLKKKKGLKRPFKGHHFLEGYRLTCNVQRLLHGLDSEVIFTLRGKEKKQRSALEDGFSFSKHHRMSRRHLMSSASKFKLPKLPSSCLLKVGDIEHWGSWPCGGRGLSPSAVLGSSSHVHVCHPRGALHAHWVCRVFSGPWD